MYRTQVLRTCVTGFRLREVLKHQPEMKLLEFFSMDMTLVWLSRHQEYKTLKKSEAKKTKCIDITLCYGHGDPCDRVKNSYNRFHRPPSALFEIRSSLHVYMNFSGKYDC